MPQNTPTVADLIQTLGKEHRRLIEDVSEMLDEKEHTWGYKFPIDRAGFMRLLVKRVKWAAIEAEEAKKANK